MTRDEVIEELRWKKFPLGSDGYVCFVDVMGSDYDVVEAARASYGKGTKKASDDRSLLRFLFRHAHATPFEMVELKVLIQIPMDHHRQLVRHRTANLNEYSTRYSEAIDSIATTKPEEWRLQSDNNKQGSGGFLDAVTGAELSKAEVALHEHALAVYKGRLDLGVAREQARKDLPLSNYTRLYWKCDLRNLFHMLGLRMDSHAQLEIRQYATVIGEEMVALLFPDSWRAFLDYRFNAVTLSAFEQDFLFTLVKNMVKNGLAFPCPAECVENGYSTEDGNPWLLTKRELGEAITKFKKLGYICAD